MTALLTHGFVRLLDTMPATDCDHAIADAARVSYSNQQKRSSDRALLRYLMRHKHTSPFEMVEFKFHVKAPIFVARQWMRHRTGSFNEVSARYSELPAEVWCPTADELTQQSSSNGQGRTAEPVADAVAIVEAMNEANLIGFARYQHALKSGVAREIARTVLPVATFTEFVWKVDLHNLLRFVLLRSDSHAQAEIRVYSDAIAAIVQERCPFAWQAFVDYSQKAQTLSRQEWAAVRGVLTAAQREAVLTELRAGDVSQRELAEFADALQGEP